MSLTMEELRDVAQALGYRNRVIEPEQTKPVCWCRANGRTCENVLTIADRGALCKDCLSDAHYH